MTDDDDKDSIESLAALPSNNSNEVLNSMERPSKTNKLSVSDGEKEV